VEAGSLILLLLSVGLLAMLFLRTRRQQQEMVNVQSRLAPGQEVMTGAGMFATVVEVTDTTVLLRAEAGQTSRWDRRAVVTIVPEPDPTASEQDPTVPDQDTVPGPTTVSEEEGRSQDTDAPSGRV